jgi:hypothetical protein
MSNWISSGMGTCTGGIPTTANIPETTEIFGWQPNNWIFLKCLIWLKLSLIYQNYGNEIKALSVFYGSVDWDAILKVKVKMM